MSTWDELGFLSDEAERDALASCRNNPKSVIPAFRLAKHLHERLNEFKPQAGNLRHLVSSLILTRALSLYEGIILLSLRGMRPESEVLLRALLEMMFMQAAVRRQPETAEHLVKSDDDQRVKLFRGILNTVTDAEKPKVLASATRGLEEAEARLAGHGVKGLAVAELAKRGGLSNLYETVYRVLSLPTHGQLRDLEDYVRRGEASDPSIINWGPDHPAAKQTNVSAMAMLIEIAEHFAAVVGADLGSEWSAIRESLTSLQSRLPDAPHD